MKVYSKKTCVIEWHGSNADYIRIGNHMHKQTHPDADHDGAALDSLDMDDATGAIVEWAHRLLRNGSEAHVSFSAAGFSYEQAFWADAARGPDVLTIRWLHEPYSYEDLDLSQPTMIEPEDL